MIDTVVSGKRKYGDDDCWRTLFKAPPGEKWVNKSLVHMGYPDLTRIHPDIHAKTKTLSEGIRKQASPRFLFKSEAFLEISKSGVRSQGFTLNSDNWGRVASSMESPEEICCFGLTLGQEIEDTIASLSSQSILHGFIYDALCSTLAEHYANQAETNLARCYSRKNLMITRRFSPGYCDVPFVETQKAIFQFCDMNAIGVTLSSSGLMIPRKSITAIVFASKRLPFRHPCSFCKTPCKYRRPSGTL